MTKNRFKIFFFIEKLNELNLDYVKKTGAILILRNISDFKINDLKKFSKDCHKRNISFFVSNNSKMLVYLKSNNFYISAHNKKRFCNLKRMNSKIKVMGSAHKISEVYEKIEQGCDFIVLSRIFETSNKNKQGYLGTIKFNLLTRNFSKKFIALGGINEKNFKKLKTLNINGCAMLGDKKKAGKYMPAFLKNNF